MASLSNNLSSYALFTNQSNTGTQPWDDMIDYTHYQISTVRRIVTRYKIADHITTPLPDHDKNSTTITTRNETKR